ncbi:MAG: recombinase family protein [Pyrinomonadaceae bacterium]|nr:recombinase family protein [Pyrinomonadaceae bacterium]
MTNTFSATKGESGATLNRPALDRLRDHVRLGDYDHILVTSPDRLARNARPSDGAT